jgi:hypothetical protein
LSDAAASQLVRSLALQASRSQRAGVEVKRPRLALYQPWNPSSDAGWTQWLLENYGFQFSQLRPADLPSLSQRYDVLILPDENVPALVQGFPPGRVPPQFEGGIGPDGGRAIDRFVRDGGTLVCVNRSSAFAIMQLDLPVADSAAGLGRRRFYASGSLLRVTTDPAHALMAGMPADAAVFFDDGPVFVPLDGFEGDVLAKYPAEGSPLMSGYLLGEAYLQGRAAALDVRHGKGHVVLIGFRPQWRGQTFGTFRVLFNAAIHHGPVAAEARGTPGFSVLPATQRGGR